MLSPRWLLALLALLGVLTVSAPPATADQTRWTATWTASPQRPGTGFTPNWSQEGFADQTVRQVVRISTGGTAVRIRLSNTYSATPLPITHATVARTTHGAAVQRNSLRHLTLHGKRTFTIPAGVELASDPMPLRLNALESITITLYTAAPTGPATYHSQALATSYRAAGDRTGDLDGTAFTQTSQSWYYLSGVDVTGSATRTGVVAAFGDSLTDGAASSVDTNDRYPDELAERLVAARRPHAVLNQGIAGNRVTVDSSWFGDKALSRFRRDVLGQPGVRTVIILEGINDLGISELAAAPPAPIFAPYPDISAEKIISGHRALIRLAHANGLHVIGATLPPVKGSAYYTPRSEAKREAINIWIRTSGEYDAAVDLDRVLSSPSDPDQLNPRYDSGDHLHPNNAGYQAMAYAINPADLD